jgi:hypothetical protein
MYLVYAGIVLIGFFSWRRIQREERPVDGPAIADDNKSGTTLSA